MPPRGLRDRKGMEGKLYGNYEVNTRAVSREQEELIGKFKMAAGDVISDRGGRLWITHTLQLWN